VRFSVEVEREFEAGLFGHEERIVSEFLDRRGAQQHGVERDTRVEVARR
jgi:hypothetical protein